MTAIWTCLSKSDNWCIAGVPHLGADLGPEDRDPLADTHPAGTRLVGTQQDTLRIHTAAEVAAERPAPEADPDHLRENGAVVQQGASLMFVLGDLHCIELQTRCYCSSESRVQTFPGLGGT